MANPENIRGFSEYLLGQKGLLESMGNAAGSETARSFVQGVAKRYFPEPKPGIMETVGKVLQTIGIGAGIGAGAVGIGALIDRYKVHQKEMQSPLIFQEMLMKNPDINEIYLSGKAGKTKVEDLYKLLEHFSPKLAENPLAAGTFMRQYAKMGDLGGHPEAIETLSRIHNNMSKGDTGISNTAMGKIFENTISTGFRELKS
jgi:hypothetical protein